MNIIDKRHKHFYLYAKGWYDDYTTGDLIFDMKKLVAQCTMTSIKYITIEDIFYVLFEIVYKEIKTHNNPEYIFKKLLFASLKTFDMFNIQPADENERMIICCLSILKFSTGYVNSIIINPEIFE